MSEREPNPSLMLPDPNTALTSPGSAQKKNKNKKRAKAKAKARAQEESGEREYVEEECVNVPVIYSEFTTLPPFMVGPLFFSSSSCSAVLFSFLSSFISA